MKIAMLISGGVDSSVALRLLKDQGHEITAFYLKIWLEDELSFLGDCPWEEDLAFVRAVCKQADISLQVIPLQKEYKDTIIAYTIDQVKRGLTPNPDMLCNTFIKFGAFYDAVGKDFDAVATGHYARVICKNNVYYLGQTPDLVKDQSYFLARLSQEQLSHSIFPLGEYTKEQVRALAQKYDLPNKDRKDSQGLCFLGKISFRDFIKAHVGIKKGDLCVYETGEKIGEHDGFWFYTLGQRQGLGLSGGPWYVVKKDIIANVVFISNEYYAPNKERNSFVLQDVVWNTVMPHDDVYVKIRHGQYMHKAMVQQEGLYYRVFLQEHDQAIAPGQFAVFYQDGLCIGSGVIVYSRNENTMGF